MLYLFKKIRFQRILIFLLLLTFFFTLSIVSADKVSAQNGIGDVLSNGIINCDGTLASPCNYNSFVGAVQRVLTFLIYASGIIAVGLFVWAGILMIFAGGNKSQIDKAKSLFWNAFIGFIIVISAWLIVSTIIGLLGSSTTQSGPVGSASSVQITS